MIAIKLFFGLLVAAAAGSAVAAEPGPASAPAGALNLTLTQSQTQTGTGAENRFDLSVNNAPAAQVFMQLGSGTAYNMLVSPEVTGNITITLKDTTVLEAMESMRELFGYDFRVVGNRIFVQPNTVQTRLFKVNYLPGRREGASDIRVTSSSITPTGTGTSSTPNIPGNNQNPLNPASGSNSSNSAGGGSRSDDTAHIRTTSDADFWREVRASLASLVGSADQRSVVLNPAAGVIVVRATPAEFRQVDAYLKAMQINIQRQVMIEAKIVSVELSEGAQAGVNWGAFGNVGNDKLSFGVAAPGATLGPRGSPISDGINTITAGAGLAANALGAGFYGLAFQASNFAAMLNFLESQGNVQVLSSPRIATLNNQKAILKVGNDELFVTGVSTSTTSSATSAVTSPTLVLQPFFSGVALDVTPQIDDAGNVMLHVHPTVSNVTEKQKNIDLGTLGSFRLPLAMSAVSETDSIVRVRNGQIVAIGGLMTQQQRDDRSGLPGLSGVPIIGALFRQKTGSLSKRELVILIKPSVIGEEGLWPEADPSLSGPRR